MNNLTQNTMPIFPIIENCWDKKDDNKLKCNCGGEMLIYKYWKESGFSAKIDILTGPEPKHKKKRIQKKINQKIF